MWNKIKYKLIYIANRLQRIDNQKNVISFLENRVSNRIRALGNNTNSLTKEEIQEVTDYYSRFGLKTTILFHDFYKKTTGSFDVRFLPETIYYPLIDKYFNNWNMARFIDNKTLYEYIFNGIPQPEIVAARQNGFWKYYKYQNEETTGDYIIATYKDIVKTIEHHFPCFAKIANDSYGGKGVKFVKSISEFKAFVESTSNDIIIQKCLNQHDVIASINPASVNTLRVISLLKKDCTVKIYSTVLRMGIGDSKVDNASSGGITVGVQNDGWLKPIAFSPNGNKYESHPTTGVKFSDIMIPNIGLVHNLILDNAYRLPFFRLVSWDIALNKEGQPILIEANLCDGELDFHQLNNGPLFGDDTEEILNEVFHT